MLFKFDRFFKVQKVGKSRIHFTASKGGLYWGRLTTICIFCLQVEGPINEGGWGGLISGGTIIGSLRYKTLSLNLAGFLKTLSPDGSFASNSFFGPKTISKVAIIKTKSATIAFFSSPPFLLLALSFSPFLFLRYCDFRASRA